MKLFVTVLCSLFLINVFAQDAAVDKALEFMSSEQYAEAEAILTEAVENKQDNARAWYYLGA
jgi:Tfp pilus assembly protein PilF